MSGDGEKKHTVSPVVKSISSAAAALDAVELDLLRTELALIQGERYAQRYVKNIFAACIRMGRELETNATDEAETLIDVGFLIACVGRFLNGLNSDVDTLRRVYEETTKSTAVDVWHIKKPPVDTEGLEIADEVSFTF